MSLCDHVPPDPAGAGQPFSPLLAARCPPQKVGTLVGGSNGLSVGFGFPVGSMGPSGKGTWAGEFCRGSEQPPNLAGTGAIPATFPDPSLLLGG